MAVAHELLFSLGDRLAKSRRKRGYEQKDMAEMIGVSRPLISKWERNKSVPDVLQARQWAEITGVSLLALVGDGTMAQGVAFDETAGEQLSLVDVDGQPVRFDYQWAAQIIDLASRRAS